MSALVALLPLYELIDIGEQWPNDGNVVLVLLSTLFLVGLAFLCRGLSQVCRVSWRRVLRHQPEGVQPRCAVALPVAQPESEKSDDKNAQATNTKRLTENRPTDCCAQRESRVFNNADDMKELKKPLQTQRLRGAEGRGFEPPTAFAAPDFESGCWLIRLPSWRGPLSNSSYGLARRQGLRGGVALLAREMAGRCWDSQTGPVCAGDQQYRVPA